MWYNKPYIVSLKNIFHLKFHYRYSEDESDYDPDDDNHCGLYNANDEDLSGNIDEDIIEKELAEVLDVYIKHIYFKGAHGII